MYYNYFLLSNLSCTLFKCFFFFCLFNLVSNKCCVPGCSQSAASKFGVPKNMTNVWETIRCTLNRNSRVCANHFKPSDVTSS